MSNRNYSCKNRSGSKSKQPLITMSTLSRGQTRNKPASHSSSTKSRPSTSPLTETVFSVLKTKFHPPEVFLPRSSSFLHSASRSMPPCSSWFKTPTTHRNCWVFTKRWQALRLILQVRIPISPFKSEYWLWSTTRGTSCRYSSTLSNARCLQISLSCLGTPTEPIHTTRAPNLASRSQGSTLRRTQATPSKTKQWSRLNTLLTPSTRTNLIPPTRSTRTWPITATLDSRTLRPPSEPKSSKAITVATSMTQEESTTRSTRSSLPMLALTRERIPSTRRNTLLRRRSTPITWWTQSSWRSTRTVRPIMRRRRARQGRAQSGKQAIYSSRVKSRWRSTRYWWSLRTLSRLI